MTAQVAAHAPVAHNKAMGRFQWRRPPNRDPSVPDFEISEWEPLLSAVRYLVGLRNEMTVAV
jgi:hypothetical protein